MTQIYMFPGQGSQRQGMGEGLFHMHPDKVQVADDILGYSIRELCLENPHERLSKTFFTQPALYTVNALTYFTKLDVDPHPDYVAGHSLGEYNALLAAGVFDFATGLQLVQKRAELMSHAAEETGLEGGMAAVLGMVVDDIQEVLQAQAFDDIDIANYNSPTQTVISGPRERIPAAAEALQEAGAKRVVVLKVSGAFHSRYMQSAADEFRQFLGGFTFNEPRLPVIANCTAQPYTAANAVDLLARQISNSVLWVDTLYFFKALPDPEFSEVGPGKVLSNLLRSIR